MGRSYEIGEIVYARWPGSALYYKATIISIDEKRASLKFQDDEEISEVPIKDVYKEAAFSQRSRSKSPARKRSRSRSQTRQRRRSVSGSPARNSSSLKKNTERAVRKPRSPAREVSQQFTKDSKISNVTVERVESERSLNDNDQKSTLRTRSSALNNQEQVLETITSNEEHIIQSTSHRQQYTVTDEQVATKRTTRSASRAKLSEENDVVVDTTNVARKEMNMTCKNVMLGKIACVGCCFSTLVVSVGMVLLPLISIYGLYQCCKSSKVCTFTKIPKMPSLSSLFNWKSIGFMFGWFGFQALLSSIPIGTVAAGPSVTNRTKLLYRLNGLPSLLLSLATFAAAHHYGLFSKKSLSTNYLSFVTGAYLFAFLLGIFVWLLARKTSTDSAGALKDFLLGRVVSPRICTFDLKMFAFKAGIITWGVINLFYLYKSIHSLGLRNAFNTNTSIILLVGFQTWYIVDLLLFEESVLFTATISNEKFGFMAIVAMLVGTPFFCSTQARYLSLYKLALPWYCYAIPVAMQLIGYYIYRVSQQQKFHFRKDQHSAKLAGIEYITTSNRKNILVDGWWGRLQHPNYLGDLLMNISWSSLCGFNHPVGWVWSALLLPLLVLMCIRDDAKCQKNYGASWDEYKRRVKYRMIPGVF